MVGLRAESLPKIRGKALGQEDATRNCGLGTYVHITCNTWSAALLVIRAAHMRTTNSGPVAGTIPRGLRLCSCDSTALKSPSVTLVDQPPGEHHTPGFLPPFLDAQRSQLLCWWPLIYPLQFTCWNPKDAGKIQANPFPIVSGFGLFHCPNIVLMTSYYGLSEGSNVYGLELCLVSKLTRGSE